MSYRKRKNSKDIWNEYCAKNAAILVEIGLDPVIYRSESIFREWVTEGYLETVNMPHTSPSELSDEKFWLLHHFITDFFDYDAVLFENY